MTTDKRLGKCYELSGRYLLDHPEAMLVHGTIQGKGLPPNPHAWVEFTDKELAEQARTLWTDKLSEWAIENIGLVVHDPVADWTCPKDAYLVLFGAREFKRYTHDEAVKMMVKTRNWGPWTAKSAEALKRFKGSV